MSRDEYLHNIHPGTMLKIDFLGDPEMGLTAYRLAKSIGISQTHLTQIVNGERGITASVSLRLGRFFNQSPDFWMNLQRRYDLEKAKDELGDRLERIVPYAQSQPLPRGRPKAGVSGGQGKKPEAASLARIGR